MAEITNFNQEKGTLAEVIKGADVFIGVSAPGTLTGDMVRTMAKDPIVFLDVQTQHRRFSLRKRKQQVQQLFLRDDLTSRIR